MTTLTLYKGVAFDGVNSFPHITTKPAFDSYLSGKQQYSQAINFNRIGEPILINESYDTAIGYSYGCIDTGSKKYYIIPDSISVNENNRVHLMYSVDWFTTLEYADAISFGRAHLIKSTDVDPLRYPQGIQPNDMRISSRIFFDTSKSGEIHVAYTTSDANSRVKWILNKVENGKSKPDTIEELSADGNPVTVNGYSFGVPEILNGLLYEGCGIRPDDIIGIYYVPFKVDSGLYTKKSKYVEVPGGNKVHYIWYEYDKSHAHPQLLWQKKKCGLTSTPMKSVHLVDRYGSIIYSVPYGRTLEQVFYTPIITPSACYVLIEFNYDDPETIYVSDYPTIRSAENSSMLYMCEKVDYNNDAYANWAMGLKGVEIEERRIQKNKALVQGIANAGLTGTIGASPRSEHTFKNQPDGSRNLVKQLSANAAGAAMGAAAGLAGPLLSYAIDTYYESSVNRIEDRKYQLAQDTMIPGGFLLHVAPTLSIVELSASDEDIARYNDEISNFGADCSLPVSSWSPSVGAYKFADVEVIADVPYSIKESIKRKLTSGIKIVRLS